MSKIIKALLSNEVALSVINSTDIVNEAIFLHKLSPVAAAALGRTLTMASIMGTELKNKEDRLTIMINGGGELGKITVCAFSNGNVKGYVTNANCVTHTTPNNKLDVKLAVGKDGMLTVIKDMGLNQPFNASVNLISGEIAEDFAEYFLKSEQRATAVALGVLIDTDGKCLNAAGVFVQILPFCSDESLKKTENALSKLIGVSGEVEPTNIKEFITETFKDFDIVFVNESETEYQCDCSFERVSRVINNIGKKECYEILDADNGKIEVCCEFCKRKYIFDKETVDEILDSVK
ncbi:MAG: Hsp33 family molecular chaperone HslO [Clostridia bacterium]